MGVKGPAALPMFHLLVLTVFDEFRQFAVPGSVSGWSSTLPRVPVTKGKLKGVVRMQWERDEPVALRQLAALDSVSGGTIN